MFEKEAEEYATENYSEEVRATARNGFKDGAEYGYNKAKEEAMMKLKDEGIVKPLKDSILRNERLSSQEQQELCAWIECAMDFGENLDECAKELEEANKANEWHYVKDGDLPKETEMLLSDNLILITQMKGTKLRSISLGNYNFFTKEFSYQHIKEITDVIAWKEIVLPKEIKENANIKGNI